MSRVFRRGELKEAIVAILAAVGEAHGYGIMGELKDRVGGGWKPSPGAIYPALVALVESGHVETDDRDGTRIYRLTPDGRMAAARASTDGRWASLTARAEDGDDQFAIGPLLDNFSAMSPHRRRLAGTAQLQLIEEILTRTSDEIERTLREGEENG
ncbi:MAG: PadR family transcriptional regulator [Actinomycetota bacterium]|nr:PadR family transcriptional regulator [Actinomycetota bacterium]